MIKTIVIEDEYNARKALIKMLYLVNPDINVVAETGYVSEALKLIKKEKPQLVILDVELEDGTGFDVLSQLNTINFKIIFTTAYANYAIKAFKFSATDYLLKPIIPSELKEAVTKSVVEIDLEKQYQELLEIVETKKNAIEKIVLKTSEQRFVIAINTIVRLEADAAYTKFITENQNIIMSKNLKYYQDILGDTFIRCHQSHLVNLNHISSLKKNELILKNLETIPVSTRKKQDILQILNKI